MKNSKNKKNIMKLTIQEIADLKEGRKSLSEIEKTHDGTSSTPIKEHIKKFVEEYSQSPYCHHLITDSEGQKITTGRTPISENINSDYIDSLKILAEEHGNDMHIVRTVEDDNDEHAYYDGSEMMNKDEMLLLTEQDNDGNYLVRSNTLVSLDGMTTSVFRNNKFNKDNHKRLGELYDEYYEDVNKWFNQVYMREVSNVFEDYKDKYGTYPPNDETTRLIRERVGSVADYIKKAGWEKRFEDECNVKLKVSDNKGLTYNGVPREELLEEYEHDLMALGEN